MSYEHYLKQKIPMCGININQISYRNLSVINSLNGYLSNPLINHYNHNPYEAENQDLIKTISNKFIRIK